MRAVVLFLTAHPLVLLCLCLGVTGSISALLHPSRFVWRIAMGICLAISVGMFLVLSFFYYTKPGFIDHIEPQIAAVSSTLLHGGTIYHEFDGSRTYGLGYGPGAYLAVAAAYRIFGESLIVAKLPSLVALLVGLGVIFLVSRRLFGESRSAWYITIVAIALGLVPFAAQIWIRGDPLLYCCAALSLLALQIRRSWAAGVFIGILMGISANLKLHGGAYIFPVLALIWARQGWRVVAWAFVPAVVVFVMPWLPWHPAGKTMLDTILVNAGHGLSLQRFVWNLESSIVFTLPLLAVLLWRSTDATPLPRDVRVGVGALGVSFLAVMIVAAKPGSGNWHLLPFIPITLYLAARCVLFDHRRVVAPNWIFVGWAAAVAFLGWKQHHYFADWLHKDVASAQITELRSIIASNPGHNIMMGYGEDVYGPGYDATFVRPVLTFAGSPYVFDPAAMMDLQFSGRPPEICSSPRMLGDDPGLLVLIPHGEVPFSMVTHFRYSPLFSDEFRAAFTTGFARVQVGRWYDTWARH